MSGTPRHGSPASSRSSCRDRRAAARRPRSRPPGRCRRGRHVGDRRAARGPRRGRQRLRRRGRTRAARAARGGCRGARRPRRLARRRRRHRRDLVGRPGVQPGARPRPRAGPAGAAPLRGARVAHGRPGRGRGGRRPRQDHDVRDDRHRAAARGRGPVLRDRRDRVLGRRTARRWPRRCRPGVRGGGGRVRRLVPRVRAAGRGRHQRRARPPRPLRLHRGVRGRVRPVRRSHPARWDARRLRGRPRCGAARRPRARHARGAGRRRRHLRHRRRTPTSSWASCAPTPGGGRSTSPPGT